MADQETLKQTSDLNYPYAVEEEISFIEILAVIVKKKWLILSITAISVVISVIYLKVTAPVYVATIKFLPPPQETYLSKIDSKLFTEHLDPFYRTQPIKLGKDLNIRFEFLQTVLREKL